MKIDLEYWQEDAETITVEPKNFEANTVMMNQFPVSRKTNMYDTYVSFGSLRWTFPYDSSILNDFLEKTELSSQKVSQELSLSASY